jgi:hypothetical protein
VAAAGASLSQQLLAVCALLQSAAGLLLWQLAVCKGAMHLQVSMDCNAVVLGLNAALLPFLPGDVKQLYDAHAVVHSGVEAPQTTYAELPSCLSLLCPQAPGPRLPTTASPLPASS